MILGWQKPRDANGLHRALLFTLVEVPFPHQQHFLGQTLNYAAPLFLPCSSLGLFTHLKALARFFNPSLPVCFAGTPRGADGVLGHGQGGREPQQEQIREHNLL